MPLERDRADCCVPLLEDFKQERQPGEGFGDFCQRLGAEKLQALLPASTPARSHAAGRITSVRKDPAVPEANGNGTVKEEAALARKNGDAPTTTLAEPGVSSPLRDIPSPKHSETFFAGLPGEERPDYTYRYHTDGNVRETIVYFYGSDQRAGTAQPGDRLIRTGLLPGSRGRLSIARSSQIERHLLRRLRRA